MFKPDKLDEHLEKLKRRSGQTESQIEQDLLDLFHEALGFNEDTAKRQVTNIGCLWQKGHRVVARPKNFSSCRSQKTR